MKPTIAFTTISVTRMPTLKLSATLLEVDVAKDVDEQCLLRADARRAEREDRGQALAHLHEQRVVQCGRDAEGA